MRRAGQRAALVATLTLAALVSTASHAPRHFVRLAPGDSLIADSAAGDAPPTIAVSADAFGRSRAVEMQFALPGEGLDYPLEMSGDTANLHYLWESVTDLTPAGPPRAFTGDTLVAPEEPGLYQLAVVQHGLQHVVGGPTLAVLVPFAWKKGPTLDGYRIGTYLAERRGRASHGEYERPVGFVKVMPGDTDLAVTAHLRLSDLLTHDGQQTWPRYVALDPRVLDKLELVLERIAKSLGGWQVQVLFDIHSGYRTPAYNRRVRQAARDSRHQYGDAVDVAIDANGDGRLDARDARQVAAVVDSVEAEYPDLVGGLGLYTSRRYRHPYVHIDARGTRVRWRG